MPLSLGLKIALIVALLAGSLCAEQERYCLHDYLNEGADGCAAVEGLDCPENEYHYAAKKRDLLNKFRECQNKHQIVTMSVVTPIKSFQITQKETGMFERDVCMDMLALEMDTVAACLSKTFPKKDLFSRDEMVGYLIRLNLLPYLWKMIDEYNPQRKPESKTDIIDPYNNADETYIFTNMNEKYFMSELNSLSVSREDKDMLLFYFRYLKMKYDMRYCRAHSDNSSECGRRIWVERERVKFFEKYPDTRHRPFIKKEMVFEAENPDEKEIAEQYNHEVELVYNDLLEAERYKEIAAQEEREIEEKKFQMSLSAFGAFGIPLNQDADYEKTFDVRNLISLGLKGQYRFFVFQYQYDMSFGGNVKGGAFSYKAYNLMGGFSVGYYKIWSVDLLTGLANIDQYPDIERHRSYKDKRHFAGAVQANYFISLTESIDVFPHVEWMFRFVPFAKDYKTRSERDGKFPMGSISFGIGVRFWKPKTKSAYVSQEGVFQ